MTVRQQQTSWAIIPRENLSGSEIGGSGSFSNNRNGGVDKEDAQENISKGILAKTGESKLKRGVTNFKETMVNQ